MSYTNLHIYFTVCAGQRWADDLFFFLIKKETKEKSLGCVFANAYPQADSCCHDEVRQFIFSPGLTWRRRNLQTLMPLKMAADRRAARLELRAAPAHRRSRRAGYRRRWRTSRKGRRMRTALWPRQVNFRFIARRTGAPASTARGTHAAPPRVSVATRRPIVRDCMAP